jgi:dienelactone hydrolase
MGLKSHLRLVKTHSYIEVPAASVHGGSPVVLFSPGWKGHLTQNTVQFEMLASHGFIVASIEHPASEKLPQDFDPSLHENLKGYSIEVKNRAEDLAYVIDNLEDLTGNDPRGLFTGCFDLRRAGVFGYSFGGAVAAEACYLDKRLKAGINMDGLMFGDAAEAGVEQPFFFMSDGASLPSEAELNSPDPRKQLHARVLVADIERIQRSFEKHGGYCLSIKGSAHSNYSDRPLYSPLKRITDAGAIDKFKAIDIINNYTLAFFDEHLNGSKQRLLDMQSVENSDINFRRHISPYLVQEMALA